MARRSATQVVDQVPPGTPDMGQAPDPEVLTSQANAAIVPWASKAIVEFHPTLVEIAKMKDQHEKLLASTDVATEDGYAKIKGALRALIPLRTAVDSRRLEEGRQARDYVGRVNLAGNTIIRKLEEIEGPLEAALKTEDARKLAEATAAAEAIERQQKEQEDARLAAIKADEDAKRLAAEQELERKRQIQEREEARLKQDREEFDRQRAKFDQDQAQLKAEQDRVRLENERLQREAQAKLDQERRDQEYKERLEREEQERKDRAIAKEKQDKIDAEKREADLQEARELAAQDERARIARVQQEKERKEADDRAKEAERLAQAPDKEKLEIYVRAVAAITAPTLKTVKAQRIMQEAAMHLSTGLALLTKYCKGEKNGH